MGHIFKLGLKHWRSDFSSAEMRLLLIATLVAAMSMTMITTFTDRLTRTMEYRASELIAGDLILQSQNSINPEWIKEAKQRGLNHVPAIVFSTMAYANDALELSRVRAVGEGYPLKGENQVTDQPYGKSQVIHGAPAPGNVWVDQRVIQALNVSVGDTIELGDSEFLVEYILVQDADRSGNFYSPFGAIMMNMEDLEATGVLGPGSRVTQKQYFTAPSNKEEQSLSGSQKGSAHPTTDDKNSDLQAVINFADWLKPQLTEHERLSGAIDSDTSMGTAVQRAQQYLSLASLVAVLLAGVAIAMASQRFSERHYETAALLRCLGAEQKDISRIFILKLLLTGLVASALGCAIGFLAHYGLFQLMQGLLPTDIMPAQWGPVIISLLSSLVVLLAFAFAPIQQLKSVSPVRVLRRELNPKPVRLNVFYLLAIFAIGGLAYVLTSNFKLTLIFVVGLSALSLLYGGLAAGFLVMIHRVSNHLPRRIQTGFNQLYRHRYYAISQLGAFAFIFTAITLIIVVRTDLFSRWQASIPADTPNHFAINVLPDTKDEFEHFLEQKGVNASAFYPIVRGRLVEINGQEVKQAVSKEDDVRAVQRELSLTWSDQPGADSEIIEGDWWPTTIKPNSIKASPSIITPEVNRVSIESELAQKLNIQVGDELTFTIVGQQLNATVHNIRKVKWDNFKPNFYMVFEPGVLNDFHHTYINSFYLKNQNTELLLDINRNFKAVTIIPTEKVIKQVREILEQTTVAVEYILMLVLLAGVVLLFATLLSTLSLRRHEAAIYRTLGASGSYIRNLIVYEYLWLGLLAGALAMMSTELLSWALYSNVFQVDWKAHPVLWALTPLFAMAVIVVSGWLASRPVMTASPNRLLREVG